MIVSDNFTINNFHNFGNMNGQNTKYIFNGKLSDNFSDELTWNNRSFKYGDGLFETIKVHFGNPIFFKEHLTRLSKGINTLKFKGTIDYSKINSLIHEFSADYEFSIARLMVFRKPGGKYFPSNFKMDYLLEIYPLILNKANKKSALNVCVYNDLKKEPNILSPFKTNNSLLYIMASIYANENGYDDAIITNNNDNLVEATSSNLFIRINHDIITPPISEGPVDGIMRNQIIKQIKKSRIYSITEQPLKFDMLSSLDEMFISNSIHGLVSINKMDKYIMNSTEFVDNYKQTDEFIY